MHSSIFEEFKVIEEYAERYGIEGACTGLRKVRTAFIQAYSMQPASQADVRTFFHGISS